MRKLEDTNFDFFLTITVSFLLSHSSMLKAAKVVQNADVHSNSHDENDVNTAEKCASTQPVDWKSC